jgi:hypothetical protein
MGGLGGRRLHEASYTGVNEFEQIRILSMVPSKSLSYVSETLERVAAGLKENGHPPCKLVYTDNPKGIALSVCCSLQALLNLLSILAEQAFHERITPSLQDDVEHVTDWSDLPPVTCPNWLQPNYTQDSITIQEICSDILEEAARLQESSSALMVVSIALQIGTSEGSPGVSQINAVQLRTKSKNIVLRVSSSLNKG